MTESLSISLSHDKIKDCSATFPLDENIASNVIKLIGSAGCKTLPRDADLYVRVSSQTIGVRTHRSRPFDVGEASTNAFFHRLGKDAKIDVPADLVKWARKAHADARAKAKADAKAKFDAKVAESKSKVEADAKGQTVKELAARSKADLVALSKSRGLKTSGTKLSLAKAIKAHDEAN